MSISSKEIIDAIDSIVFEWQKHDFLLDSRTHHAFRLSNGVTEVSWGNDGYVFKDDEFSTIDEYVNLVDKKQYSMLLADGSFFQFSYRIKRNEIVGHRLCWYPSPIVVENNSFENESIQDVVLRYMADFNLKGFKIRGPIRIDYAPEQKSEEHPEVHLHVNEECCRIPVKNPLCLKQFMTFIVENFYSDLMVNRKLYSDVKSWSNNDLLTVGQRKRHHLNIVLVL